MIPDRQLVPELLDCLPSNDPRCIRSRTDLRRINAWMGNSGFIAKEILLNKPSPLVNILDIGTGDGLLALSVAHRIYRHIPPVTLTVVDKSNLVSDDTCKKFARLGWKINCIQADLHDFLEHQHSGFDLVTANLFLHHFEGGPLIRLLRLIANLSHSFVACEPIRTNVALTGSRMLGVIGCNDVTKHDAVASVFAGFSNQELSSLWPSDGSWKLKESSAGLFSHMFSAVKAR